MPDRPFLARVRQVLPDLHPAEAKLGALVCDFPGELASYSASELAVLADVSKATVSRFVRRLGYASYEEARRDARAERDSGSRLYLAAAGASAPQDPRSYGIGDMANVQDTLDGVEPAQLDRLVAALLGARQVWVIGFRAGAGLAQYLQWQLLQVVEHSSVLPGPGQTLGEHLASVQGGDVVIVFALRRRVAQTGALLDALTATGARLAVISDESMGRHGKAEWHFRCATASSGPLFSHVGVMALLNLLANRTIAAAGDAGRRRLVKIEAGNDALAEL